MDKTEEVRYKEVLLQTMKTFISFCKEHDLTYYACGGTAIGAVRHKGMIPWDDDIDVYMDRENYNRFIALSRNLQGKYANYEVVELGVDGYYLPFTKFADKRTTILEESAYPFVFGVYIDIFPLDYTSGSYEEIAQRANHYRRIIQSYTQAQERFSWGLVRGRIKQHGFLRGSLALGYQLLYCKPFRRQLWRKAQRTLDALLQIQGDKAFCYGLELTRPHEIFEKDWFGTPIEMPFEDFTVSMPQGYDAYLRSQYGDYMELPPVEQRASLHGRYFVDLDHRWEAKDAVRLAKQRQLDLR